MLTAKEDDSLQIGAIIGGVTGSLILALVAMTLMLILVVRKKMKVMKKMKVLETQNSEASLRYVHTCVHFQLSSYVSSSPLSIPTHCNCVHYYIIVI